MEVTDAPTGLATADNAQNFSQIKIGIYGWRKRCIYAFILTLLIMVILNLALSLWIFKVMEFSPTGMGTLNVLKEGLSLDGDSFIMNRLIASHIESRKNDIIALKSNMYYSTSVRNQKGRMEHLMTMGNNSFECLAKAFKIKSPDGKPVFVANGKKIVINSECLKITGEEGTVFKGSIQAPSVNGDNSAQDLRITSPTKTLEVTAAEAMRIESRNGNSEIVSGEELVLQSKEGSINLQVLNIKMPHLPLPKDSRRSSNNEFKIFQVCLCKNGKLFLAPPESTCFGREWRKNCR